MRRNRVRYQTLELVLYFAIFCAYLRWALIPLFMLGWFGVIVFLIGFFFLFWVMVRYALMLSGIIKTHVEIVREEN